MNKENSEQLILNLPNEQSYAVDEYIILASNQLLVDQLLTITQSSSPLTILFGEKMSGKTHLSYLWQAHFSARFLSDSFLKMPEENVPELAELVKSSPLIIDDINKKPHCEKTIFHLINLATQYNQPLLFTSSTPLNSWGIKLPDLLSRLKAAKHIEISTPDDMLIETILTKAFAQKQLNIADNVIAYILPRIDRSIEAIVKLVEQLDTYALQEKKPITRMMVAKLLENRV